MGPLAGQQTDAVLLLFPTKQGLKLQFGRYIADRKELSPTRWLAPPGRVDKKARFGYNAASERNAVTHNLGSDRGMVLASVVGRKDRV